VSETANSRRPAEPRVSLGVPQLDDMLAGGLMPHRPYLLVGPAGTGKTTLALQFLCEGVRRGERCLYVTVEDPPNEVRWNHRALRPELDAVEVFDAIPDVMRYERTPFKDISATREVVPFAEVPEAIRQTPEFTSVEVTGTALEQMLRSEVQRRGYGRLVIDSLTALQYFCMKGFDPTVGAQTFLRFLTDLRTTTILTVESPLEDVETPERMLARGEIRLFRWELEGVTVRAIGVEKLRGSSHDVRLHPYRIGSKGIDVQLAQTISRDTRKVVEPALTISIRQEPPPFPEAPVAGPAVIVLTPEPLAAQVGDLLTLGVDVAPLRKEVEAALSAVRESRLEEATARLARLSAMAISLAPLNAPSASGGAAPSPAAVEAYQRVAARTDTIREGKPPTQLPPLDLLAHDLAAVLELVPPPATPAAPAAVARHADRIPPPPAERPPIPVVPSERPPEAPGGPAPAPMPAPEGAHPPGTPGLTPPATQPVPPPSAPSSAPAPSRATSRRPARASLVAKVPEPPPLPTVARLPATAPPRASPTAPAATVIHEPSKPAATPARRRRRVVAPKVPTGTVAPEATTPLAPGPTAPPAEPKPKKRVVRRKKAPPVVSATATPPPAETAPAAAPASPPPAPTTEATSPKEAS